jgi:predicted KAP-like P-loop ATPase
VKTLRNYRITTLVAIVAFLPVLWRIFPGSDVRLADFVLLEVLRVMEPRVYELILDGQNLLVGTTPGAGILFTRPTSGDPQEQANRATAALVEAICEATERQELNDVIRSVLEELFPRVEAIRRRFGEYGRHFLDEWTNERRVCVLDFFRTATRWGLPSGTISNSEIRNLVSIADPRDLRARLRIYDEDVRDDVDYAAVLERIGPFYRTQAEPPALEAILRVV